MKNEIDDSLRDKPDWDSMVREVLDRSYYEFGLATEFAVSKQSYALGVASFLEEFRQANDPQKAEHQPESDILAHIRNTLLAL